LTFAVESKKASNEPVVIAHMHPKERIIGEWTLSAGTVYTTVTSHYVVNVSNDGVDLTEAGSSSVSSDEWFFDPDTMTVHVDVGADPADSFVALTYRLFYSNRHLDFPFDMSTGRIVPYSSLLDTVSKFKDEIDADDLVGISLSGTADLAFKNDSTWDDIYGRLFWETTECKIYAGFAGLAVTEYQLIYKGFIDSKSFSPDRVTFKLKDFIEKLRAEIPLNLFSDSDGDITEQDKPKKRVYGRAKVLGVSLEKIKDGFSLTGTFSKTTGTTITGVGSDLINEMSVEDEIKYINILGDEVSYSVESVDSSTVFTLTEEIDDFSNASAITCVPTRGAVPFKNRSIFVCDHQMREPATTVASVTGSLRHFSVVSTTDMEAGDTITVAGETKVIEIVSESNFIALTTSLTATPSIGAAVTKNAVFQVWADERELLINRDFTIVNGDPSKITIDDLAEFNLALPKPVVDGSSTAMTFTNGSDEVTGNVAFKNFFKVWDWVRSDDVTHATYYQILDVQEDKLILRSNYGGATRTSDGERKNIVLIGDDTRILIDCAGITENGVKTGVWVNTGSKVVEHILEEQNLVIDATSFNQANVDAPYLISLVVPLANNSSRPKARDVIDKINRSILGSLHENADRDIVYNVLSPRKGTITEIFRDDDNLKYSIKSTGKNIARKIVANYQFEDADIFTGEYDNDVFEYTNTFIDYISDIQREEQLDLHLYKLSEVTTMGQRIALLREAANTVVKLESNSLFLSRALNELVYLELRDMFNRFGTDADNNFIGVINFLSKSVERTDIEVTDLGGFYNKIATYADSGASVYSSTSALDRASDGYYTDSNGIIDDSKQNRLNVYG
jgi:hypothetical protein